MIFQLQYFEISTCRYSVSMEPLRSCFDFQTRRRRVCQKSSSKNLRTQRKCWKKKHEKKLFLGEDARSTWARLGEATKCSKSSPCSHSLDISKFPKYHSQYLYEIALETMPLHILINILLVCLFITRIYTMLFCSLMNDQLVDRRTGRGEKVACLPLKLK